MSWIAALAAFRVGLEGGRSGGVDDLDFVPFVIDGGGVV